MVDPDGIRPYPARHGADSLVHYLVFEAICLRILTGAPTSLAHSNLKYSGIASENDRIWTVTLHWSSVSGFLYVFDC